MAAVVPESGIAHIGETAGAVWKLLVENGPMSMAKLVKGIG